MRPNTTTGRGCRNTPRYRGLGEGRGGLARNGRRRAHCLWFRRTEQDRFFSGTAEGPIVVFIHGGYWQALDGSFFSHLAAGLNAHGVSVAIPSYDLCPDVTVEDIIGEMRSASRELAKLGRPLVISGHSAGGHLAACMLATDWRALMLRCRRNLVSGRLRYFGPVRSRAAGRDLHQHGAASRRCSGPRRKPAVLEGAGAWKSRCGRRRRRERGISSAKPDHRRSLGRGRSADAVRHHRQAPTILPRSPRSPIPARRWCGG